VAPGDTEAEISGDASGAWSVDDSIGSFDDFSGSWAGYRVQEELTTIGASTAVGRTPGVTGELTIEGSEAVVVQLTVDLTTLESDESLRDRAVQGAVDTQTFPQASFVTTDPVDLGGEPDEGTTVATDVAGELTLHGETLPVTVTIEAELLDGVIVATGSIAIDMTDYGISPPKLGPVVSISDQGEIEFQLFFSKD
jgi:polyisoprenoid-binding protein YceI